MNVRTARQQAPGFTLLELLVVLAIAGLLMSIVPPVVAVAVPGARLKSQAVELAATLRSARNRAVSLGRGVDVVFDTRTPAYTQAGEQPRILSSDIDLTIRRQRAMLPVRTVTPADGVSRETLTLRFYPDGSTSGAVIAMNRNRSAYLIELDWLIGRVSVSAGTDDGH